MKMVCKHGYLIVQTGILAIMFLMSFLGIRQLKMIGMVIVFYRVDSMFRINTSYENVVHVEKIHMRFAYDKTLPPIRVP